MLSMHSYFDPCHIFNIIFKAILSILLILSVLSTFVFNSRAKIRISALTNRFLSVSSPIDSSKSSCTQLVKVSKKRKMPSVGVDAFFRQVLFKFLINLFKNECGVDTAVSLYLLKTKKICGRRH